MKTLQNVLLAIIAALMLSGCNSTGGTTDGNSTSNITNGSNRDPVISGTPSTSVAAGEYYSFLPVATDADGDSLTFSVSNLPAWASFNTANGQVVGTPIAGDSGIYSNIVISVTDGHSTVSMPAFSISVVSNAQTGSVVGFTVAALTVTEGSSVSAVVTRSNSVGEASVMYGTHGVTAISSTQNGDDYQGFDPIELVFADGETSKSITIQTLDNAVQEPTETFELYLQSPSIGYTLENNSVITVSIIDNDGSQNQQPAISGTPSGNIVVGGTYTFTPAASDPDGDSLSFDIANQPSWASFDVATGSLTGTPTSADVGTYSDIAISVSDGIASTSLPAFSINVSENNHIPSAQADTVSLDQNGVVTVNVLANDSGLDDGLGTVTVVANATHGTLQVNPDNTIRYTPDSDFYGADNFTYQVTDRDGDSDTAQVSLTVDCVVDCAVTAPANTYYVRAGANGNNSGSDWSNAFTQLPDTLLRGATYLISDGTYPNYNFNDQTAGSDEINIRKATVSAHGTNTGWIDTYGDGQAVFGLLNFTTDYYVFDGISDYGFKTLGQYQGLVVNVQASHVRIVHTDIDGNFQITNGYQTNGACTGLNVTGTNVTIESSDIHNIADDGVTVYDSNQVNIVSSKIHQLHACGTDNNCGPCYNGHSDGLELNNTDNLTISGNLVYDIKSTAAVFTGNWSPTYLRNLTLTNNIFYTPETGLTVYLQYIQGANVYNNVIWGVMQGSRFGGLSIGPEVTDLDLKNNIILSVNFSHTGGVYNPSEHHMDYNLYGVLNSSEYTANAHEIIADPLFNAIPLSSDINLHTLDGLRAEDFMLKQNSPAIDRGLDLTGIVDTDILGNVRPRDGNSDGAAAWDLGPFEVQP